MQPFRSLIVYISAALLHEQYLLTSQCTSLEPHAQAHVMKKRKDVVLKLCFSIKVTDCELKRLAKQDNLSSQVDSCLVYVFYKSELWAGTYILKLQKKRVSVMDVPQT